MKNGMLSADSFRTTRVRPMSDSTPSVQPTREPRRQQIAEQERWQEPRHAVEREDDVVRPAPALQKQQVDNRLPVERTRIERLARLQYGGDHQHERYDVRENMQRVELLELALEVVDRRLRRAAQARQAPIIRTTVCSCQRLVSQLGRFDAESRIANAEAA